MRRLGSLLLALAAVVLATAIVPGRGLASCAPRPPLAEALREAPLIFVGTVVRTTNDDRWADVAVEQIWKGPDLPPLVPIRAGTEPGAYTSTDRSFQTGRRYLFVPRIATGALTDDSCSATQVYDPSLDHFRPASVRSPVVASPQPTEPLTRREPSPGGGAVPLIVAASLAGSVALFGLVILVARRHRTS